MKLTMKGDYGLRAMLDLAAYYGQGPVDSAEIAGRQCIPEHYLDQILLTLRKEGLVKSVRGPRGGHMLAKPPASITMAMVIEGLEGYVPPMECLPNPAFCQLAPGCALREIWRTIDELTQAVLTATTIEELARQHHVGNAQTMYSSQ
ncbi:MAG: Rrf2 family transcriptional regulator [Ktedonobacteraceae bacterium]